MRRPTIGGAEDHPVIFKHIGAVKTVDINGGHIIARGGTWHEGQCRGGIARVPLVTYGHGAGARNVESVRAAVVNGRGGGYRLRGDIQIAAGAFQNLPFLQGICGQPPAVNITPTIGIQVALGTLDCQVIRQTGVAGAGKLVGEVAQSKAYIAVGDVHVNGDGPDDGQAADGFGNVDGIHIAPGHAPESLVGLLRIQGNILYRLCHGAEDGFAEGRIF